ncbi:MAG: hypothetical protein MJK14_20990 [Rivularia sp. ALOHA_DT_140]|nr:hypothetical protein [Rivularia sp. ALOHA_DT_140]
MSANFIALSSSIINVNQIASIKFKIRGSKCDAGFDERDRNFTLIVLSNGEKFRIPSGRDTELFLKKIGIDF